MIIILEGFDNSGKSTLSRNLSNDLGFEVYHPGGPPKNKDEIIQRCAEQSAIFFQSSHQNLIFDRITCISDRMYRIGFYDWYVFQAAFTELMTIANIKIVFCRPSKDRLLKFDDHVMQAHEDQSVVDHAIKNAERIIENYDTFFDEKLVNCDNIFKFNFEDGDQSYIALMKFLRRGFRC